MVCGLGAMPLLRRLTDWWESLAGAASPSRTSRLPAPPGAASPGDEGEDPHRSFRDSYDEERDNDDPVVMPIEEAIDLHHFAPRDIPSVVEEYLYEAQKAGFHEVRVIHGRGKGVQRRRVQLVLASHPAVESSRSDGLGSTLVTLRPLRT